MVHCGGGAVPGLMPDGVGGALVARRGENTAAEEDDDDAATARRSAADVVTVAAGGDGCHGCLCVVNGHWHALNEFLY
jgi:hypothetical protein